MYIEPSKYNKHHVVLTHKKNEAIEFHIGNIAKANADIERVLTPLNRYWSELPESSQDAIWGIYCTMADMMENIPDITTLTVKLVEQVNLLYHHHKYDHVFVATSDMCIDYPKEIKRHYDESAPESPLTYLVSHYEDLVALSVMLKPMIPIFGHYAYITRNHFLNLWKEFKTCKLITETEVVKTAAYHRLSDYITHTLRHKDIKADYAALLENICTDEIPGWLLAIVVVRRLPFCELSTQFENREPENLVSNIYNYLNSRVVGLNKSKGGMVVREKEDTPMQGDDEDNISIAERAKMKETISEGSIEMPARYFRGRDGHSPDEVCLQILDSIVTRNNLDSIDAKRATTMWHKVHRFLKRNDTYTLNPVQMILCELVVKNVCDPRAIRDQQLDNDTLEYVIVDATVVLWYFGFEDFATMLLSKAENLPDDVLYAFKKKPMAIDCIDLLKDKYQFWLSLDQTDSDTRLTWQKLKKTFPFSAVEEIVLSLNKVVWEIDGPVDLKKSIQMCQTDDGYFPSDDIYNQLAKLIHTVV